MSKLTPRQRQVALLLADGCTHRQIAERLTISRFTASTHVRNIRERLGAPNSAAIAAKVSRVPRA